jgi:hypothetical protein
LLESHKNSDWDVKIILVSDSGGIPEWKWKIQERFSRQQNEGPILPVW